MAIAYNSPIYYYPIDLVDKNLPEVRFTCNEDRTNILTDQEGRPVPLSTLIAFPVPAGLTFSDTAIYTNISLGGIGQAFSEGGSENVKSALKGANISDIVTKSILDSVTDTNIPVVSDVAKAQLLRNKKAVNPNINTAFQNVEPRNFEFSFRMASHSEKQAKMIYDIIRIFRTNTYPTGDDFLLTYPSTWKINFYKADGTENEYLPAIYDCYLVSTTVVYNESSNMFHRDGAPTDVRVSLSFRETDSLKANQIYKKRN